MPCRCEPSTDPSTTGRCLQGQVEKGSGGEGRRYGCTGKTEQGALLSFIVGLSGNTALGPMGHPRHALSRRDHEQPTSLGPRHCAALRSEEVAELVGG